MLNRVCSCLHHISGKIDFLLSAKIYFGRTITRVPDNSIVFFPYSQHILFCGLAGIIAYKSSNDKNTDFDIPSLNDTIRKIQKNNHKKCILKDLSLHSDYLGGQELIKSLLKKVQRLKNGNPFYMIFSSKNNQEDISKLSKRLTELLESESKWLIDNMGRLSPEAVDTISCRIESLKDIAWCLDSEIIDNVTKVKALMKAQHEPPSNAQVNIIKHINAALNSLDRLEVRGRDSAGISLMFILNETEYDKFMKRIQSKHLADQLKKRMEHDFLMNKSISVGKTKDESGADLVSISFVYKVAAEIGSLGDNVRFLREQIKKDLTFQTLSAFEYTYHTVSCHTRWASVGEITEANCHPVDNIPFPKNTNGTGMIHVCLNGDIDNHIELKSKLEAKGKLIHKEISTDTKIIPLQIQKYISRGLSVEESFRLAVNDFEGSHAISMHTDLAPGKFFLAQRGSGQSIFIGMADGHYIPTSEVYGFVEETPNYIKLDGINPKSQGQIFILNQEGSDLKGLRAIFYDGTPLPLDESHIKHTDITSRDTDRQGFPHYFLKEITESPVSVEKTLQNRWKINQKKKRQYEITLEESVFPARIQKALVGTGRKKGEIRRVFFVGQGTAGVAAQACANILSHYMDDPLLQVSALKSSELSGFQLNDTDNEGSMSDVLVIAITQSGTTTDTNRTIDMVKDRGAHTIAIVNRRDSDITFKVDGVMYTSSGRDIEMSVASTKAFYSQIIAGALLSLTIAQLRGYRSESFVSDELKQLLEIPSHMRKVFKINKQIEASARKVSGTKTYWAAVGSGPNKASADEIRIKLSELCYKTISSDYVEDKKHIDLSSEPLIIVCAAGTRSTVIGDIIKDTAIFQAHKAVPIVIANKGEKRFDPFAEAVFHVPVVSEHLAPILNTLVGHIWGYYAALTINEGSRFLYRFRENILTTLDDYAADGLDVYEVVLQKPFREKIAGFYNELRNKISQNSFPVAVAHASDLTLLLKYLSGKLPVSDFEIDFREKGTALNMLNTFFRYMGESINYMSRPVDAIKHQAKTVTVGTSRISEKVEGILFDALHKDDLNISQLTNSNIIVLKNLQEIVGSIDGSILYRISGLNLLGETTEETLIKVLKKKGSLKPIPSRVEKDTRLQGTKKIIVRQGNVYIGKGRKDDRSIIIIPVISTSHDTPNLIEYLLLLNISFMKNIPFDNKIKALGGKYEHIKNIVQENSIMWNDQFLELVETEELFGISAEKIGEYIVNKN